MPLLTDMRGAVLHYFRITVFCTFCMLLWFVPARLLFASPTMITESSSVLPLKRQYFTDVCEIPKASNLLPSLLSPFSLTCSLHISDRASLSLPLLHHPPAS